MFFFFKQKTAYEMRIRDWSSDVCSSDLFVYQAAKIAAPAECRALVKIGRLKSEIAERSALEEASDEVLWIATFFDLSEPDKGIVAAKFGSDCIGRIGFA